MQWRSQLKTNPGALSIKYQGIYTITKEIHGKDDVDISNFWFYCGARAPGKVNVAFTKYFSKTALIAQVSCTKRVFILNFSIFQWTDK